MASRPLVTAIIPTYGRSEYLVEAVSSVAAQTYDPLELVVVDDYSPEPVESQLSAMDLTGLHRVVIHRHNENRGANAARNTGFDAANGNLIAFLDDDDRWRPTKILRQVTVFRESGSKTGVVYTGLVAIDGAGRTLGTSGCSLRGDVTRELLCGASIGSFTRLMVRAEELSAAGSLDEALPGWQDRDLNIRLSTRCEYESIDEPLAVHRRGSHEQIGGDYEGKRDQAYPRLIKKHRPLAVGYGPAVERRFLAAQTFALGMAALNSGNTRAARGHMLDAIRYDPTYLRPYTCLPLTAGERLYERARRLKQSVTRTLGRTRSS